MQISSIIVASNAAALEEYKYMIPLIGTLTVILLFGLERLLSYKIRKKERKINWYYKAFIDPSMDKINSFFDQTKKTYQDSAILLQSQIGLANFSDRKAHEIGKFQIEKRDFEDETLLPIVTTYNKIGSDLTNVVLEIEDLYVNHLDKVIPDETYNSSLTRGLSKSKAKFLEILFNEIQKK